MDQGTTTITEQRTIGRVLLRGAIVLLTLSTAGIHASLGGLMFLANAAGYTALAIAMAAPQPVARARPLIRVALLGFTAVTLGGWLLFGARFPLAYVDKAIEVALIVLIVVEMWVRDGGPLGVIRWGRRCLAQLAATLAGGAR